MKQLSVSQAESFDHTQRGGCNARWYFERVLGFRAPPTASKSDGTQGHALLATYLKTGKGPEGRVKMGTAVRAAIAAGNLPAPGPDLAVETRFDGQAQYDAEGNWIPLDTSKTLWVGGVPWDGAIDLRFRRDGIVSVWDHKFTSDLANAKRADDLIKTIQLPVYCLDSLRVWPDATKFEIAHHNVARSGGESNVRRAVVTLDEVLARKAEVETLVVQITEVSKLTRVEDVPFNRKACDAWGGCPHQSRCPAFKEKLVPLSQAELEMFADLEGVSVDPVPVPTASVPAGKAEQGKTYLVDNTPATFLANTTAPATKAPVAAFIPTAGGPPLHVDRNTLVSREPGEDDGDETPTVLPADSVEIMPGVTVTPDPDETIADVIAEAPKKRARKTKGDAPPEPEPTAQPVQITDSKALTPGQRDDMRFLLREAQTVHHVHELGPETLALIGRILTKLGA